MVTRFDRLSSCLDQRSRKRRSLHVSRGDPIEAQRYNGRLDHEKHDTIRYVGLDFKKDTITIAAAARDLKSEIVGAAQNAWTTFRHRLKKTAEAKLLRCCYEAGPYGFELFRQLTGKGIEPKSRLLRDVSCRGQGEANGGQILSNGGHSSRLATSADGKSRTEPGHREATCG